MFGVNTDQTQKKKKSRRSRLLFAGAYPGFSIKEAPPLMGGREGGGANLRFWTFFFEKPF